MFHSILKEFHDTTILPCFVAPKYLIESEDTKELVDLKFAPGEKSKTRGNRTSVVFTIETIEVADEERVMDDKSGGDDPAASSVKGLHKLIIYRIRLSVKYLINSILRWIWWHTKEGTLLLGKLICWNHERDHPSIQRKVWITLKAHSY